MAGAVTRLLREHPPIDVELDGDGRLVAIRWNGQREPVEVCNAWRVAESWWREPIERDYCKVVGDALAGARLPRPGRRDVAPGAALRLTDWRSEHHGQCEEEAEERHHEGERLDIVGARGSVLHAITPEPTGPRPVAECVDGGRSGSVTRVVESGSRNQRTCNSSARAGDGSEGRPPPQCIEPSTRKTTPPTRTAVRTRAPATSRALTCTDLVSRAIS